MTGPANDETAMSGIVVRSYPKPSDQTREAFSGLGVATVHEAQGRTGLLAPEIRPIYPGARVFGTAVTVRVPPGDNWMIHVAIEECGEGDILVVAPSTPSSAGYFGELLATSVQARGVRGLVIDAGCRDLAELREMGFPVWSRHVSAQGTVKETLGDVNVPIVCAGALVTPGDVVVADDDGVVIVPSSKAGPVAAAAREREDKEQRSRVRYERGELSLDILGLREPLAKAGLRYVTHDADGATT